MSDKKWKKHFQPEQLLLEHEDPHRFVRGPYNKGGQDARISASFVAYRLTIMLLFVAGLIWSLSRFFLYGKWFIFLTHQGYLLCVIQSIMAAFIVCQAYMKERTLDQGMLASEVLSYNGQMPLIYKIYWVLYNIAIPTAFFISILYWSLLYKQEAEITAPILNIWVHGINSLLCLTDLILGGPPSRLFHFIQPILFALFYMVFNIIYWAAGGTDPMGNHWIYPVLDWGEGTGLAIGLVVLGAFLMVVLHAGIWGISNLRDRWANKQQPAIYPMSPPTLSPGKFNKGFVSDNV